MIVYPVLSSYNPFLVYCRELAPSTVSLTGDRAQGDDSKHDLHYTFHTKYSSPFNNVYLVPDSECQYKE